MRPRRPEAPADLKQIYRGYRKSARKRRSWAADNPGNVAIRAELLAHVVELAGARLEGDGEILDVGCGGGRLLGELSRRGVEQARLHGVDLLEGRVSAARRRLPEADIRLADAGSLPFPDGEFELVTLLTCLSSMPDREAVARALSEADRVLAPGGLLLCYEPWIGNPFNSATRRISNRAMRNALGRERASLRLTGFPPLARRLGRLAPGLYPWLTRLAPTHRLRVWSR